jgi:hypothetical protein
METIRTIADAEALAAKYGIALTPQDYADMEDVLSERRRQLESHTDGQRARFVDKFNKWYPKILQALLGIGDVLITMTHTILIAFGLPAVLLMLMIVEQQRVGNGMALFEVHPALATFGAVVLVLCNLLFELLINWNEHRHNYTEPPHLERSLRLFGQRLAYVTGRSSDWQPRPKSPAHRERVVLRIITFTILALALAGSMDTVIQSVDGNWWQALTAIFTRSSLLQMITWLGGLLFAVAAVISAQTLSRYVAQKVVEVVAIMNSSATNKPELVADALGVTGANFLMARISEKRTARRLSAASAADMPAPTLSGVVHIGSSVPETIGTSTETKAPGEAVHKALKWLEAHPDSTLSQSKAAAAAGVSKSTMNRAMNWEK